MSYYGLQKGDVRLKYTPHSLQVRACVILHTQGLTEPQIQSILRWKLDAFKMNLRNVPARAGIQRNVIHNSRVDSFEATPPVVSDEDDETWPGKLGHFNRNIHYTTRSIHS
jgi:hypothetical protein